MGCVLNFMRSTQNDRRLTWSSPFYTFLSNLKIFSVLYGCKVLSSKRTAESSDDSSWLVKLTDDNNNVHLIFIPMIFSSTNTH